MDTVRHIFGSLGFGGIDDDDLKVLIDSADTDRDGRISLADFRSMMDPKQPEPSPCTVAAQPGARTA